MFKLLRTKVTEFKYILFQRVIDGNTVESLIYSTRSVCHAACKQSLILYS